MARYRIVSGAGVELGIFEGETEQAALDAMAQDAGYESQADAEARGAGTFDGRTERIPTATFKIQLDAERDLAEAGHDIGEAESMEAAWREVMGHLVKELGLDVQIIGTDRSPTQTHLHDGDVLEHVLWQSAHDHIEREDDGTWVWSEPSSDVIAGLRRALDRMAA